MKESEKFGWVLTICIIAVLILIVYTLAAVYYVQEQKCLIDTNTYCYDNWKCYDIDKGDELNVSKKFYLNGACSLITQETINNFPYTNILGEDKTGNPGQEINVWDPNPDCQSNPSETTCAKYQVNDIYWKACHGTLGSEYCTTDEGKC